MRILLHTRNLRAPFVLASQLHFDRHHRDQHDFYRVADPAGSHGRQLCRGSYHRARSAQIHAALGLLFRAGSGCRIALLGYQLLQDGIDMHRWSVITEGRVDLWTAAWAKFIQPALTGFGADSWADDLIYKLPGFFQVTNELVSKHAGGYHNAYLTLLAEEGIFIFSFALYILWCAYGTVIHSPRFTSQDKHRQWALQFAFAFLTLRGLIEVPGLFGYGEDPAEFCSYALLALIISYAGASTQLAYLRFESELIASTESRQSCSMNTQPHVFCTLQSRHRAPATSMSSLVLSLRAVGSQRSWRRITSNIETVCPAMGESSFHARPTAERRRTRVRGPDARQHALPV